MAIALFSTSDEASSNCLSRQPFSSLISMSKLLPFRHQPLVPSSPASWRPVFDASRNETNFSSGHFIYARGLMRVYPPKWNSWC